MVPAVWLRVVGHRRPAVGAVLADYCCLRFQDAAYPGIVPRSGCRVQGLVYSGITQTDLHRLDDYEGSRYQRTLVSVHDDDKHPITAWTYLTVPQVRGQLCDHAWSLDTFVRSELEDYLASIQGCVS
jgi:gamma-glutamylcyclotransferase (GGCT)/AIG2-like uncharacterized protein YtfP